MDSKDIMTPEFIKKATQEILMFLKAVNGAFSGDLKVPGFEVPAIRYEKYGDHDAYLGTSDSFQHYETAFHKNYEWLMHLWNKIEETGYNTVVDFSHNPFSTREDKMFHWAQIGKDKIIEDMYGSSLIDKKYAMYVAAAKFCAWHNKENKTKPKFKI